MICSAIRRIPLVRIARDRLGLSDGGSAIIEFIVVGVLITMPVFYLVVALARLQAGSYAVAAAARESSRMFATAADPGSAQVRANSAARMAFADQGFDGGGGVAMSCPNGACLSRGSSVQAVAELDVELPLIPDFLRGAIPSSIHVSSRHVEAVDRFKAS